MPFEEIEEQKPHHLKGRPSQNPDGRPTILQPTEDTFKQINGLARIQCTQKEAAAVLGVHRDTFVKFLNAHEKAQEAWEDGAETGKASLRRHQFKAAESGNATMQIWLGKQWLDQTDKSYQEIAGKDGAAIKEEVTHVGLDEFASRIVGIAARVNQAKGNSESDGGAA